MGVPGSTYDSFCFGGFNLLIRLEAFDWYFLGIFSIFLRLYFLQWWTLISTPKATTYCLSNRVNERNYLFFPYNSLIDFFVLFIAVWIINAYEIEIEQGYFDLQLDLIFYWKSAWNVANYAATLESNDTDYSSQFDVNIWKSNQPPKNKFLMKIGSCLGKNGKESIFDFSINLYFGSKFLKDFLFLEPQGFSSPLDRFRLVIS